MNYIPLVELVDDLCLSLRHAVYGAGPRATITGSLAEAREALRGTDEVALVVLANAVLPNGYGLVLICEARQVDRRLFLFRAHRRRTEISSGLDVVFRGTRLALGDFLRKAVLRRPRWKTAEVALHVESR